MESKPIASRCPKIDISPSNARAKETRQIKARKSQSHGKGEVCRRTAAVSGIIGWRAKGQRCKIIAPEDKLMKRGPPTPPVQYDLPRPERWDQPCTTRGGEDEFKRMMR